jgi:hypothetical protein
VTRTQRSLAATVLTYALGGIALADLVLHILVRDVEPLRVTGNVVVMMTAVIILIRADARVPWIPLLAGAVNLGLNILFIALERIGPLGVILIVATTVLAVLTALALRPGSSVARP